MVKKYLDSRRFWLGAFIVTAIFGVIFISASRIQAPIDPNTLVESPRVGDLAPDFELVTLEGEVIRLSDLRGRPVVLNFWASWCAPCRIETPHFQAFHESAADDLVVLGVNQQESPEQVAEFADEFSLTYALLLDPTGRVNGLYEVFGLPSTYFIDANGVIVAVAPGAITEAYLADQVSDLIE